VTNTTEYNNGLHVFVFCCADYKDIVDECIESIDQFVTDPILSRNIVSNTTIDIPGYNLIRDRDFWSMLDPDFSYKNLYNHNWIKQQIFKLNLNRIVKGHALVIDAEVRFQQPTQWIVDNKQTVFYDDRWPLHDTTEFVKRSINVNVDSDKSFIVEAVIFSTDILEEIQVTIEKLHLLPQLTVYQQLMFDDPTSINPSLTMFMSEYDMYINYLINVRPERISTLIKRTSDLIFYSKVFDKTSNSIGNQTSWITFYDQIRDPSWPDCDKEEDFYNLPEHIQTECVEVFGYRPSKSNH